MSKEFKQGQKLRSVFGPTDNDGCYTHYTVGKDGCIDIEVVMENGQMAGVPWAYVTIKENPPSKINLAVMEEVRLIEEKQTHENNQTQNQQRTEPESD